MKNEQQCLNCGEYETKWVGWSETGGKLYYCHACKRVFSLTEMKDKKLSLGGKNGRK